MRRRQEKTSNERRKHRKYGRGGYAALEMSCEHAGRERNVGAARRMLYEG
jgi:hypothetical protein